jgi:large subunit ribosomal protein L5
MALTAKPEKKLELTRNPARLLQNKEKIMAETKKTTATKAATSKATEAKKVEAKPAETKAPAKTSKGHKAPKDINRLEDKFNKEIKANLMKKFEYKSVMQVPSLNKIVLNVGVGDATEDKKRIDEVVEELAAITGQKPIVRNAKKSIATFKLREGEPIGVKVTLRGKRMYEFFDKLVSISLPRVRDFRGVNKNSFDGRGNYTLGIKEQLIFPEIVYDKVAKVRGMDIIIVTTANTDEEAYALLKELGMPFSR